MKSLTIGTMILALTLVAGCRQTETTAVATEEEVQARATARELTPEQLGELGAKIVNEPERADELLTEQGLTRETLEAEIRRITEDPEASKRYAQAYENAKA